MKQHPELDQLAVNAIRILSAEAVQKANSGHPGLPMGAAPIAYELWSNHLCHNPANPNWFNRDRFVLSAGHGSMLLYSLLHLFNYGLPMEELKAFRQWGSQTPGHPEYGHTAGVEMTTGPLGQGLASAVGMALAEAHLAARFNREGFSLIDHYTYVLSGDGCLMEGISSEASSLAGHLKLGKLIVFYDDNDISIEGSTELAFTEDVADRYRAYHWQVLKVQDANDRSAIAAAIEAAQQDQYHPSLIIVSSQIGYGSPLAGTAKVHGEPLGEDNLARTRETLGWKETEPFTVPAELRRYLTEKTQSMQAREAAWQDLLKQYRQSHPAAAAEFDRCLNGDLPDLLNDDEFWQFEGKAATRATSGVCLNRLSDRLPGLIGGSADLAPSTKTEMKDKGWIKPGDYAGRNIHFGVREFAMAAAANGIALHGGLRVFCSTFFVFSDYLKASLRLSAIMKLPVIYVFTHDSIGVGEDGPTHEPIEHLAALRATPGVTVFRPADGKETAAGYITALQQDGPTCLVLSRQNLPTLAATGPDAMKGGYVLRHAGQPDLILMASGSEVEIIMAAADRLADQGIAVQVVSMPSFELFEAQTDEYKEQVLPRTVRRRLAVEAGSTQPWYRYTGLDGQVIGLDQFGASAPGETLYQQYGLTAEHVVDQAGRLLSSPDKA